MLLSGIQLRAILWGALLKIFRAMCSKITLLKLPPDLPKSNELILTCVVILPIIETQTEFSLITDMLAHRYNDVIMSTMASKITAVSIVYSTVCSGADKKHQGPASLAFVGGIHRWPVNNRTKSQ